MADNDANGTTYLAVDQLAENPRLARRLRPELARRFHALPLAEDRGRVTVAMADPTDVEARDAVLTALGPASCVVQADAGVIDTMLSRIWADAPGELLDLTICGFPEPISDPLSHYVQGLGSLLQARVDCLTTAESINLLAEGRVDTDLIVFGQGDHPLIHRLLAQGEFRDADQRTSVLPLAVLIAQQPRWPLERILLVTQGEGADDGALDWVLDLARSAGSTVTVLAVVPPIPAMYGKRGPIGKGLPGLLCADSPLGRQMRRTSHRLVDWEVPGTLRLREGLPDQQVCREVKEGDYDLVALASPRSTWWRRCLEEDLVGPLLRRVSRPVLVVKPKST